MSAAEEIKTYSVGEFLVVLPGGDEVEVALAEGGLEDVEGEEGEGEEGEGADESDGNGEGSDEGEGGEGDADDSEGAPLSADDYDTDSDPFAGTASTTPTVSLEVSDALFEEVEREGAKALDLREAAGEGLPYTVHPDAAARDKIIVYDETTQAYIKRYKSEAARVGASSRAIAAGMRRILLARSAAHTQRDQRHGTLDRSKLHTLNRPGFAPNRRVFARTVEGQTQDVVIGLLIDQSGSMGIDFRINCARLAALALAEALAQLEPVGVRFGVWGFDADAEPLCHADMRADRLEPLRFHRYKDVDESWRRVAPRIAACTNLDNNVDGESVRWAAHQLLDVRASRRVLIVLSDGHPCAATGPSPYGGSERLYADLKRAVGEVKVLGVEPFGLGIQTDAVSKFYPDFAVVHDVDQLEGALMGKLRAMLLGGGA